MSLFLRKNHLILFNSYVSTNSASSDCSFENNHLNDSEIDFEYDSCDHDCQMESSSSSDFFSEQPHLSENLQQQFHSVEVWQFLLELLENKQYRNVIRWVNSQFNDNEFIIYDSVEIARKWATRRNKPNMTYKKFNRILRSYYNKKNILKKMPGKHNTFMFQINILPYMNQIRFFQNQMQESFIRRQCQ
jgi:hypothetical protein